ncbi:MAG: serine protease [Bryobacteraceae bacterium]
MMPTVEFPQLEYVMPILVVHQEDVAKSFEGTGVVVAPGLFLTCWHCVRTPLSDGEYYAAVHMPNAERGPLRILDLLNITQDESGLDVALANIRHSPPEVLRFDDSPSVFGEDIWTWAYRDDGRTPAGVAVTPRLLKGYITRPFKHQTPFGITNAFELDLPAPAGTSGAPIFRGRTNRLMGLIYGEVETYSITDFERVHTETGQREPEVRKIVSFAVAHRTETLMNARGRPTKGLTVRDYIAGRGVSRPSVLSLKFVYTSAPS